MVKSAKKKKNVKGPRASKYNASSIFEDRKEINSYRKEELEIDEIRQRIMIKWLVVLIGLNVMLFMGYFVSEKSPDILYQAQQVDNSYGDTGVYWFNSSVIAAPIISITTITVMFFVGAFKNSGDKDLENTTNIVISVLRKVGIDI